MPRKPTRPLARRDELARRALDAASVRVAIVDDSPLVPKWVPFPISYTLFDEALTTADRTLWTMPPNTIVLKAVVRSIEAFTGPSLSSATLRILQPTSADARSTGLPTAGIDVFITPTDDFSSNTMDAYAVNIATKRSDNVDLLVQLDIAGCNCNQLTGGEAAIYLLTCRYEV